MRRWISWLALALAFALATWVGWWGVAVVGGLYGALRPRVNAPAATAGTAAVLAWGGWLLWDRSASAGRLPVLLERLAGVLHLPAPTFYVLTLAFGFLLAWSVTALAEGVCELIAPRDGAPSWPDATSGK